MKLQIAVSRASLIFHKIFLLLLRLQSGSILSCQSINMMMVQFMSNKSGLKTRSLGLYILGTAWPPSLVTVSPLGKLSWGLGLKSHPKDRRSQGSNQRPLDYKASSVTTMSRRLLKYVICYLLLPFHVDWAKFRGYSYVYHVCADMKYGSGFSNSEN